MTLAVRAFVEVLLVRIHHLEDEVALLKPENVRLEAQLGKIPQNQLGPPPRTRRTKASPASALWLHARYTCPPGTTKVADSSGSVALRGQITGIALLDRSRGITIDGI